MILLGEYRWLYVKTKMDVIANTRKMQQVLCKFPCDGQWNFFFISVTMKYIKIGKVTQIQFTNRKSDAIRVEIPHFKHTT